MTRPRVFIARRIPDEGIRPIEAVADTAVWPGELPPPRAALRRIREFLAHPGAEAAIAGSAR